MADLTLGALDFGFLQRGQSSYRVLHEILQLASHLDQLGYSRLWVGEHHGPAFSYSAPEILLAVLAGVTERLRVGSACVLLNYYSPLKVAEAFRTLEALFPERIDLGVGPGVTDDNTACALFDGDPNFPKPGQFDRKVEELGHFLRSDFPKGHAYEQVLATPLNTSTPMLWVMGSLSCAVSAGRSSAALCLPLFLRPPTESNTWNYREAVELYCEAFRPSADLPKPCWVAAVAGACVETEAEAREIASRYNDQSGFIRPTIVGTPEQCREALSQMAEELECREVVFLNLLSDTPRRLRSYTLLAEAFRLPPLSGSY